MKEERVKQEKISVGRKRIFKKLSQLFFGVNFNVYERTSLQALCKMLQPLKHWRKVVVSSINIKRWFLNFVRGITVILSNHFIHWDIIRTCWNWKQVGIYNGKLTLYSQLKISLVQLGEQRFLKCLCIFFPSPWPSAQGCVHQSCTADTSLREKLIGLSSLGVGDFILRSLTFKICSMPDYGWAMVTKIVH